jgi:aldose sugar dehydrogenase
MPMTDYETYPDAMVPAWENNQLSQGISSAAYLAGDHWGDWEDKLVVSYMGIGFGGTPPGQRIDVMDIAEDGASAEATEFPLPMEPGRFRSLVMGPDDSLYVAIDEGDIYRITPN